MKPNSPKSRMVTGGSKCAFCFWGTDLAPKGKIWPKHVLTQGTVNMVKNESHGIEPGDYVQFDTMLELGPALEKLLVEHGVTLHLSDRSKQHITD